MTWSQKRRLNYFLGFAFILAVLGGIPAFILFYEEASCFDNKKNQGELGIDCSGPCIKLCSSRELQPVVQWQQTLEVIPEHYTAVAYVQNPNIEAEAKKVVYTFTFYDATNKPILERKGSTYIPAGKSFAVVEPGIKIQGKAPSRTLFELDKDIAWTRAPKNIYDIEVKNQLLTEATTTPIINANLQNLTFNDIPRADVVALVYDTNGNVFAASRTFVKDLFGKTTQPVVFTWPRPFPVTDQVCKAETDVIIALDRSGSMASEGPNPPQPLTAAKDAASTFVDKFSGGDQGSVISFATDATLDQSITADLSTVKSAISSISINSGGTQYTNVADAVLEAITEFGSARHKSEAKKALVILTDGIPTYPEQAGNINHPSELALERGAEAKQLGIEIFTIGLGKDVDAEFLKSLASGENHYYTAPTSNDLTSVYGKVAESLCKIQAVRVEIIATIPPL